MTQTSWIEINLTHLEANLEAFRTVVGNAVRLCACVKADAYGLGATRIAQRLANRGIDMLAVYSPDQAQQLTSSCANTPILLLMPVRELPRSSHLYRATTKDRLHFTIHDTPHLEQVDKIGLTCGCRIPVHLYLDTGISRSGLDADEASALLTRITHYRHVRLAGIWTHLATADSDPALAQQQMQLLDQFLDQHRQYLPPDILIHAANTFATLRDHTYHRSMTRVGLGLLGYGDNLLSAPPQIADAPPLKPIVRWLSKINHIRRYPKGTPIGYGCTHRLTRESLLGVVPVGYADGYPQDLGNRSVVRVLDSQNHTTLIAPVLGRVSMDQLVIDLTPDSADRPDSIGIDTPAPAPQPLRISHDTPTVGTVVELISDDPQSPCALPKLAQLVGSNCYELLCRISPRLPRRYTESAAKPHVHVTGPRAASKQPSLTGNTHS